jgi:hypothetical protein
VKKTTLLLSFLVLANAPACGKKKHACHEECATEYVVEERVSGPAGWGSEEQIEEMEETIEFEETLK